MNNSLVYGKANLDRIVSVEPGQGSTCEIFRELEDGSIESLNVPMSHYLLFADQKSPKFKELAGNQHYKYLYETDSRAKYEEVLSGCYKNRYDFHVIRDAKEAFMIKEGYTYFKGMKVEDVSVLSFDIETTGLAHDADAKVLLISNTFRRKGKTERKLFSLDEYQNQGAMIADWCAWVRSVNPSAIVGHNILTFDLPYLNYVAKQWPVTLRLGRDDTPIKFATKTSQFRKDGSQTYDYHNAWIYGREIVDTYFLSIKYDIGRNYESYGLKQIIKQEGLKREGRTHYDASRIRLDWHDEEKRKQIKAYAIDDADDALKLYDLMIPSLFYYAQSIPRSFQQIINTATGSQINSLMIRGYLQQGHSIAKGSDSVEYEGAISFGNPGVHKNVLRLDVASLYPSVMRQYQVHNKAKDPLQLFLKIVEYFTLERLQNKKVGKETGDRYYKDMEQAQKIVINSAYGFLGAPKLNYNYPEGAAEVTAHGRRILTEVMTYLESKNFKLVAGDTDGIAFKKADEKPFTLEERQSILAEINSKMDELIRWEDDGVFKRQIVVKAKNYILQDENGKVKIKGSGLKATTKEKALQRFISELIELLLKDKKDQIFSLYFKYANDIVNLTDISDWCVKKTVTKSVLNPERTNEQRVMDALDLDEVNEGDKVYMFNVTKEELCLRENFKGVYCVETLLKKLYNTLAVFDTILDIDLFPNFSLVRNREMLGLEPKKKARLTVVKPPLDALVTRKQETLSHDEFWNIK